MFCLISARRGGGGEAIPWYFYIGTLEPSLYPNMSEHVSTDNTLFSNIWQIVNCNTVMVWWSSTILTWTESRYWLLLLWMGISCLNALIDSSSVRKLVGTFSPFAQWDRIIIALHKKICTEHIRFICVLYLRQNRLADQTDMLSTYLLMQRIFWSHCATFTIINSHINMVYCLWEHLSTNNKYP